MPAVFKTAARLHGRAAKRRLRWRTEESGKVKPAKSSAQRAAEAEYREAVSRMMGWTNEQILKTINKTKSAQWRKAGQFLIADRQNAESVETRRTEQIQPTVTHAEMDFDAMRERLSLLTGRTITTCSSPQELAGMQ